MAEVAGDRLTLHLCLGEPGATSSRLGEATALAHTPQGRGGIMP